MNLKLIVLFLLTLCVTSYSQVAVIVNKSNPTASLSAKELKALFSAENLTFSNGKTAKIAINKADANLKKVFYSKIGTSFEATQGLWAKKALNEGIKGPTYLTSDADVENFVESNPTAIGFVNMKSITSDKVKIVPIDGAKSF